MHFRVIEIEDNILKDNLNQLFTYLNSSKYGCHIIENAVYFLQFIPHIVNQAKQNKILEAKYWIFFKKHLFRFH